MWEHCLKYKRKQILLHFCVLSFLTTITLLHRVLFWLFVNYMNTLIATCHIQRSEGREESSHFLFEVSFLSAKEKHLAYCQQNEQTVVRGIGAQERQEGGTEAT